VLEFGGLVFREYRRSPAFFPRTLHHRYATRRSHAENFVAIVGATINIHPRELLAGPLRPAQ